MVIESILMRASALKKQGYAIEMCVLGERAYENYKKEIKEYKKVIFAINGHWLNIPITVNHILHPDYVNVLPKLDSKRQIESKIDLQNYNAKPVFIQEFEKEAINFFKNYEKEKQ
ncbi:hypothetical protein HZP42_18895 [Elizabethkingia anophelis]|nr:hypothetical protein [Elizabethkingia anophelis]